MRESLSVEPSRALAAQSPAARQALRFRATGFAPAPRGATSWLVFVIVLALWQAAGWLGLASALFLPSPSAIVRALWRLAASGELWTHVSISLMRIGAGWIIGTGIGISVGLAVGLFSFARAAGLPIVSALFPIPKIALLPLLILWLGIGETSKIATIALGVFFPTVIAVYSGVDQVPNNLIRMAQSFELPFLAIVRKVVVPGALPNIVAGFRISASIALLLVVSAEMIGAEAGIGAFVLQAGNLMQTDQLMAGVVVLSILGLAVARGIGALEARVTRWR
jgi:ABC-type nitrate/sulfonate/bicarbonate transport system permease component